MFAVRRSCFHFGNNCILVQFTGFKNVFQVLGNGSFLYLKQLRYFYYKS